MQNAFVDRSTMPAAGLQGTVMKSQSVLIVEDESIAALAMKAPRQELQSGVGGAAEGAGRAIGQRYAGLAEPSSPACGRQATTQGDE